MVGIHVKLVGEAPAEIYILGVWLKVKLAVVRRKRFNWLIGADVSREWTVTLENGSAAFLLENLPPNQDQEWFLEDWEPEAFVSELGVFVRK